MMGIRPDACIKILYGRGLIRPDACMEILYERRLIREETP